MPPSFCLFVGVATLGVTVPVRATGAVAGIQCPSGTLQAGADFVGGEEDLVRGVVRAIGDPDARFDEDKLRILRAPRFAGRLGFRIDAKTAESCASIP